MQQHAPRRTRQAVQEADGVRVLAWTRSRRRLGLLGLHRARQRRGLSGSLRAHELPAWACQSEVACNVAVVLDCKVRVAAHI